MVLAQSPSASSPSLLGMDVGYAAKRRSTAFAWRVDGTIGTALVGTAWELRRAALPKDVVFDLAALDAPVVPVAGRLLRRGCEDAFYRGAFAMRCKPGLSHHGRGLDLRQAGEIAARDIAAVVRAPGIEVHVEARTRTVVEAFPNTFLGVLLPPEAFPKGRDPSRPKKSDIFFEAIVEAGILRAMVERLGWADGGTVARFEAERDHDLRAALICLLTAGFVAAGEAVTVGDATSGWFSLPPHDLWSPWAKEALATNLVRTREKGFPDTTAEMPLPLSVRP